MFYFWAILESTCYSFLLAIMIGIFYRSFYFSYYRKIDDSMYLIFYSRYLKSFKLYI